MQIVHDYKVLHTIPELDRTLPKTLSYIQSQLLPLRCKILTPTEGAMAAFFDFGKGDTLAFRADMDALPVEEKTGLPWQSLHPGNMHACGHDGHTAILLELARRLEKERSLPHNVLLLFQPAEETTGGAKNICETGILQKYHVENIFGLHLWPGLPKGHIFSRPDVLMSGSCGVTAEFFGHSVHIAHSEQGADALAACCEFCRRAEYLQGTRPYLLKFGKIVGGRAENILCDHAKLVGSLRMWDDHPANAYQKELTELCHQAAKEQDCNGKLLFRPGYPAVRNNRVLLEKIQTLVSISLLEKPFLTTEDFSYYQQQVPGVYFLLGIGNAPPLHSPIFSFDPEVLTHGADLFHTIAKERNR